MKTGFWLRNGKGKLAGATVYQQNGETVMREVVSPSNPKTTSQLMQRVIMHTIMSAYSLLKEICDHSFEGVKSGRDCMAYFMSQNLNLARQKVAQMIGEGVNTYNIINFLPLGYKGYVQNQYQVAMGSLPQIQTLIDEDESVGHSQYVPGITTNTYQAVIDALGLKRGDQLTFMIVRATTDANQGLVKDFKYCRVILDPTNADGTQAPLSVPFLDGHRVNLPSLRNEGDMLFNVDDTKGLYFYADSRFVYGACVIASRQVGDKWLRSTTYISSNESEEYSLGQCMQMAEQGTKIYTPNALYLNNAGEGAGDAASYEPIPLTVDSATFDSQVMVVGTPTVITAANGTSFPISKALSVVLTGTPAGNLIVKPHAGGDAVATIAIASNTVTGNISCAKDVLYDIYVDEQNTGLQFKVEEAGGLPGGGGGSEG